MNDEHVMETLGKARVVIRDGRVVEVGTPQLSYCPLFYKHRGISRIDAEVVRVNIQQRIDEFGLFTERRDIEQESFVGFGTSEIYMSGLRRGALDVVVTVCEGAGTVVTANPALVQGIGARLSGIVSTTPIPGLIKRITGAGGEVLFPESARIDQEAGVAWAVERGYRHIGVSFVSAADARACKERHAPLAQVVTSLVHTSGCDEAPEDILAADLVTACASRLLWQELEGHILLQAGTAIPVFALTQAGKELLLERAKEIASPLVMHSAKLPEAGQNLPEPLF